MATVGLWSGLKAFLGFGGRRSTPDYPDRYLGSVPWRLLPTGFRLTLDEALQVAAVWACVDCISSGLSPSPWIVSTKDAEGRTRELLDDSAYYLLNVEPNADMCAVNFREALAFSVLTVGNAYAEIIRDRSGRVAELEFLPSDRTCPLRLGADEGYRLVYEYYNPDGTVVLLPQSDVLHFRGPGITGLMGDNIVARAAQAIGVAAAAERFAGTYFGNNTVLGGVIEHPGIMKQEAYDNLKKSWEERHKGPANAHKVAILEGGAKYIQVEGNAETSQLVQSRTFQLQEIARWYRVPPHKIGDLSRGTFSNIEWQSIEFVRDCLRPWAIRFEQEVNRKLFPRRSLARTTSIDLSGLIHGDAISRANYYKTMREAGLMSINEARKKEGMDDIGAAGDSRMVPLNMQTLEQLELAEEEAKLKLRQLQEQISTRQNPDPAQDPPVENPPAAKLIPASTQNGANGHALS